MNEKDLNTPEVVREYLLWTKGVYSLFVLSIFALLYFWLNIYNDLIEIYDQMTQPSLFYSASIDEIRLSPLEWFLIGTLAKNGLLSFQIILSGLYIASVAIATFILVFIHSTIVGRFLRYLNIDKITESVDIDVLWNYLTRNFVIYSYSTNRKILSSPSSLYWSVLYYSEFVV